MSALLLTATGYRAGRTVPARSLVLGICAINPIAWPSNMHPSFSQQQDQFKSEKEIDVKQQDQFKSEKEIDVITPS